MANKKRTKGRSRKAGLPPGTLMHIGEQKGEEVRITLIDYDEQNLKEKVLGKVEESFPFKNTPTVTWLNIDGLHKIEIIEKIGNHFGLHPLIMEDILNTGQRPKLEDYGTCFFIVVRMLSYDNDHNSIQSEQVCLVLGDNFVISFQEEPGDVFEQIRDRIRNNKGKIRKMRADYLAYSLIDAIVDNYFIILEALGEQIETLEDEVMADPSEKTVREIHRLKRELISLNKSVWPLREVVNGIEKSRSALISDTTDPYLRDVYDHTIQIIDTVASYRDMVTGIQDIYLSSISNRMNSVMKVLTVIATIFIPLTFVAGVYGMNFEYMPELKLRYGYPVILAVMATVAGAMLVYFKRKKWL
jgi:magnesium transporter